MYFILIQSVFFPHFHISAQNATSDATEETSETLPSKKDRIGLVLSKDGDFFDPGLVEIERILEVAPPEDYPASKLPNIRAWAL